MTRGFSLFRLIPFLSYLIFFSGCENGSFYQSATDTATSVVATDTTTASVSTTYVLAFTQQPSSTADGSTLFVAQPIVAIQNSGTTAVTQSTTITLAAYSDSACTSAAGTAISGTAAILTTSGVSTFAGLSYSVSGTIYLKATATGFTSACSNAIAVSTVITSDSFTGAGTTDAAAGGVATAWTSYYGTWGISSNRSTMTSSLGVLPMQVFDSGYRNGFVQVVLKNALPGGAPDSVGLIFRGDPTGINGWLFHAGWDPSGTFYALTPYAGGVPGTTVATHYPSGGTSLNDVLRVDYSGAVITAKVNGVVVMKIVNTTYIANTYVGVMASGATFMLDDFIVDEGTNTDQVITSDSFSAASLITTDIAASGTAKTWTTTGTWAIASNQAYATATAGGMGTFATALFEGGTADASVQIDFPAHSSTAFTKSGIAFRAQSSTALWALTSSYDTTVSAAVYELSRLSGTDIVVVARYATTLANDIVRVELLGPKITVKVNGTTRIAVSDSTYQTATQYGLFSNTGTGRMDNFLLENDLQKSTITASDSFNRIAFGSLDSANYGISQAWAVPAGTFVTSSNAAAITVVGGGGSAIALANANLLQSTSDIYCTAEVTLTAVPSINSTYAGLMLMYVDSSNYIQAVANIDAGGVGSYKIIEVIGGVSTTIATSTGVTPAAGDVLKATVNYYHVSLSVNGTSVAVITSALAGLSGYRYGLIGSSIMERFDDFKLYDCFTSNASSRPLTDDTFSRGDSATTAGITMPLLGGTSSYSWIDADWNGQSGFNNIGISSSAIYGPTAGSRALIKTSKTNCTVQATLSTINSANSLGVIFRGNDDGSVYYYVNHVAMGGPVYAFFLGKYTTAGGFVNLGDFRTVTPTVPFSNGDVLSVEFYGGTAVVKINGGALTLDSGSNTLDVLTGTHHGIQFGDAGDRINNFKLRDCVD